MTHDDPKLTAYALNELDQADRAEVEGFLAENESARRFVEETRRTVAMLTAGLREVATPSLTGDQRQAITAASKSTLKIAPAANKPVRTPLRVQWAKWALATAACAAIAAAGYMQGRWDRPRTVVVSDAGTSKPVAPTQTQSPSGAPNLLTLDPTKLLQQSTASLGNSPANSQSGASTRIEAMLYDWQAVSPGTAPLSGYIPAPFTSTGNSASGVGTLTSSQSTFPGKDVKIVGTTGNASQFNNPELSINYAFLDYEGAGGGALTQSHAAYAGKSSASGTHAGNFRMYPGVGDNSAAAAGPSLADYLASGMTMSNQDLYPGAPGQLIARGGNGGGGGGGGRGGNGDLASANVDNGFEVRRLKNDPKWAGDSVLIAGVGSSDVPAKIGGKAVTGQVTLNNGEVPPKLFARLYGTDTLQNGKSNGQPAPDGDFGRDGGKSPQLLSRSDLSALVAHYRNRGVDSYHLLDGGVVGYTQAQFEEDSKTGNFPPEVAAVFQRKLLTAAAPNESYAVINDNPFLAVAEQPLSTFSIDVDTGSYSNIRRFLNEGHFPPPDAVRIEEMLNYFPYQYETPKSDSKEPFAATVEIAGCPWNGAHRLARVAIKGREIAHDKRPVSNIVFLIDVSGSMNEPAKLPLVKEGLKLMVNELTENDRISIVVYAGNAGLVLPSTTADPKHKQSILDAIDNLSAGGSTNGGQGIELAYHIASENFIKGGTNRVLLATDGDWNVGITDQTSLMQLIQDKAKSGVFLSVLGYGFGNLKDATMEKLADKGNGHYAYIDNIKESKKVLVEEMSSTLVTIAKDVKIQVEFNPLKVESYRLIGYEKRLLRKEDFNNDKVDAGEIGAGHCVTALYEISTIGADARGKAPATQPQSPEVDALKYQKHEIVKSDDLMTLKMRYKQPDGEASTKIEFPAVDKGATYSKASEDFKFSAAVAQFGMILRNSPHRGTASLDGVIELADEGKGKDEKGYRAEFVEMVKKARTLTK